MSGDYLQIFAPLGANGPVAWGFAEAMDNHRNVTSGRSLTCAGQTPIRMGIMDWAWLTDQIGSQIGFRTDGHVDFDGTSPLQQLCSKAAARTR
jgi:hypothetical protein